MKKKNTILIILLSGTLFLISFVIGYKIMNYRVRQQPLTISENKGKKNQNEDLDLEILKEEETISPNTVITLKKYYHSCDHSITNLDKADDEIVNMTKKQFEEYIQENYPNIKLISFSVKEIVLREERNHLCSNHYIVGESNGNIAIYGIDENGKKFLDKVFSDYPISLLKEIDQKRLINGIVVDSEEELSDVLENFIS